MGQSAGRPKGRLRWYQFGLWHLFVLVVICAIPCSWLACRMRPIRPLDVLRIRATGTLLDEPIHGEYLVGPDGSLDLGCAYGRVPGVAGLTMHKAKAQVTQDLQQILRRPRLVEFSRVRRVKTWRRAEVPPPPYRIGSGHLLRIQIIEPPLDITQRVDDAGCVHLGPKPGAIRLAGLTFDEAQRAVLARLQVPERETGVCVSRLDWKLCSQDKLPKAPYRIGPGDLLGISVPFHHVHGTVVVEPDGWVPLGPEFGRVRVGGLTITDAEKAIELYVRGICVDPTAHVTLDGWKSQSNLRLKVTPPTSARRPTDAEPGDTGLDTNP